MHTRYAKIVVLAAIFRLAAVASVAKSQSETPSRVAASQPARAAEQSPGPLAGLPRRNARDVFERVGPRAGGTAFPQVGRGPVDLDSAGMIHGAGGRLSGVYPPGRGARLDSAALGTGAYGPPYPGERQAGTAFTANATAGSVPAVGRGPDDLAPQVSSAVEPSLGLGRTPLTSDLRGPQADARSLDELRRAGPAAANLPVASERVNQLDERWNRMRFRFGYEPYYDPYSDPYYRAYVDPRLTYRSDASDRWIQQQLSRQRLLRPRYPYFTPYGYSQWRAASGARGGPRWNQAP
jgi:hypothetical protein